MATANPTRLGLRESTTQTPADTIADKRSVTVTERQPSRSLDTVVVYVDGSYHHDQEIAVSGVVLRGNDNETYRELWTTHPESSTSMETESAAVLNGIQVAQTYDPSHIVVYSDCEPVVRRIQQRTRTDLDVFDRIYRLLDEFDFVNVHHIPRKRNQRADEVAHLGLRKEQARVEQLAD